MRLKHIEELFDIQNGIPSKDVNRVSFQKNDNWIPYIRPSYKQDTSIDAYVNRYQVPSDMIYPQETIYVSTDGQGSHTYSYVSTMQFVPNSNVSVLIPKSPMTLSEKLFYSMCITHNRYKFSYGRKPKGVRLEKLLVPDINFIPSFVNVIDLQVVRNQLVSNIEIEELKERSKLSCNQELVPLSELFDVKNGISASNQLRLPNKRSENWIPLIRPSYRQDTSIDAYVNKCLLPQDKVFPKGSLYVSTNGQGSHTYSYVSVTEFVPNSDVAVLIPKRSMTLREKLFYSMCISCNRFKFSYGRKPKGDKLESIMLPKTMNKMMNEIDLLAYLNEISY